MPFKCQNNLFYNMLTHFCDITAFDLNAVRGWSRITELSELQR